MRRRNKCEPSDGRQETHRHVPDLLPRQAPKVFQESLVSLSFLLRELRDALSQDVLHLSQAAAGANGQSWKTGCFHR